MNYTDIIRKNQDFIHNGLNQINSQLVPMGFIRNIASKHHAPVDAGLRNMGV